MAGDYWMPAYAGMTAVIVPPLKAPLLAR